MKLKKAKHFTTAPSRNNKEIKQPKTATVTVSTYQNKACLMFAHSVGITSIKNAINNQQTASSTIIKRVDSIARLEN